MKFSLLNGWVWKMAWRESRTTGKRLFLFVSSIILGVAALVAINSFGHNLERAVDEQAKSLLGADLVVTIREPFSEETEELFRSWGGDQSREVRMASMVYFPASDGMRLVEIRALEGDFPYYGELVTSPPEAAERFRQGPYALVDDRMMLQFDVEVGDSVKIGAFLFTVAGKLQRIPGETMTETLIAPRVYIPLSYLSQTELVQFGSRVSYRNAFRWGTSTNVDQLLEDARPHLDEQRLRTITVEDRKRRLGRSMENLYRFMSLVGFIALVLGGIGVASAIHIHIRQRLNTVAVLRCLGASSQQASMIYVIQAAVMSLVGGAAGALLGIGVQNLMPPVLKNFLPVVISFEVSWGAVWQGLGMGLGFGLLFALLPLLTVRRISPLVALRFTYQKENPLPRDPLRWLVYGLIALAICLFSLSRTQSWTQGLAFAGGTMVAFLFLLAVANLITALIRRFFPDSWSYVWRQGLANLHRPNNQTTVVMLALGLGTFLITTLFLVQGTLLNAVSLAGSGDRPDMVLFDIQSDQREEILQIVRSMDLPVQQDVPIVTMRLASINGRTVQEISEDPDHRRRDWALFREYRSTYRDRLIDSEELMAGEWHGSVNGPSGEVQISLEKSIAEDLGVAPGDQLVFDVQGMPIETTIGSLRQVDWERMQTNFFVVFPVGVLEEAPQFHVLMTQVGSAEASAQLQRTVVQRFPNVSTIDMALVMETVDAVLDNVTFVIRTMALFSIITGLVVLVGAVISSRYQRIRESVLLRTLGASRQQIRKIMAIEYLFLGFFSALTGLILAVGASWALAFFLFDTVFVMEIQPVVLVLCVVVGFTMLIGALSSRGLTSRPPLESLRAEV
ncbi:MAG: FtsX-like permease family protein [Acidobacteriota bacterium]